MAEEICLDNQKFVKEQPVCRHAHITEKTKTGGTPYVKGWCEHCKAFVYTDKRFCICCMKRCKHETHHLGLKRILNAGIQQLENTIDDFERTPIGMKYNELLYGEIVYNSKRYHIPMKYILLYKQNKVPKEMYSEIQDHTTIAR